MHAELIPDLLHVHPGAIRAALRAIRPGDALFVVTFRSYAPDVQEVARRARAAGVPIVAITDSDLSPVYPIADACFVVHGDQRFCVCRRGVRWLSTAELSFGSWRARRGR